MDATGTWLRQTTDLSAADVAQDSAIHEAAVAEHGGHLWADSRPSR